MPQANQPFAVVDIGSNTVKLSVFVNGQDNLPRLLFQDADTVRIGHNTSRSGWISEEKAARLLMTLRHMEQIARDRGSTRFFAVATEAFRRAANGEEVRRLIHDRTAWQVDIISGDDETRLTYESARPSVSLGESTVIADVGGASTELVTVSRDGIMAAGGSVAVGSGSLYDEHIGASPPPPGTLATAVRHASDALHISGQLPVTTDHLLLPGGTGHFLQALATAIDPEAILDDQGLQSVRRWLAVQDGAVTAKTLDMQVERARVLPASLAIVDALTDLLRPSHISAIPGGIGLGMAHMVCAGRYRLPH